MTNILTSMFIMIVLGSANQDAFANLFGTCAVSVTTANLSAGGTIPTCIDPTTYSGTLSATGSSLLTGGGGGSSSADLITGNLYASATNTPTSIGGGSAMAGLFDTLTFHGSGTATLTLPVTKTYIGVPNGNFVAWGRVGYETASLWPTDYLLWHTDGLGYYCGVTNYVPGSNYCELSGPASVTFSFIDGQLMVLAAEVFASAGFDSGGTTVVDPPLVLTLSNGATYTSASGDFLGVANPGGGPTVPEPGTVALMLAGLGMLGIISRRKGKQNTSPMFGMA